MSKGYESLIEAVKADCNNGEGCFDPNGCDHEFYRYEPAKGREKIIGNTVCRCISKCTHKYCDKFKWIIDRAKHYEDKLGISWEDILDSWEENRNYWYMNYYQEANQPKIDGDKVRVFDTIEDFRKSVGNKGFRCPSCGGITTNPYECNSGMEMSNGEICDWKIYGFFGGLGKEVFVYIKEKIRGEKIFMPIEWEGVFTNE